MNEKILSILKKHKLRKTPFRMEVLRLFLNSKSNALNNNVLESKLEDFDRITLYRTLKTFEKSGIIHEAIDGSNETKYALCHDDCTQHNHEDNHAHFLCNACQKTICLDDVVSPAFQLPSNYKLEKVHVALSGTCAECA